MKTLKWEERSVIDNNTHTTFLGSKDLSGVNKRATITHKNKYVRSKQKGNVSHKSNIEEEEEEYYDEGEEEEQSVTN